MVKQEAQVWRAVSQALNAVLFLIAALGNPATAQHRTQAEIGLDAFNIPVTDGAAPGFVADAVCGTCHGDLAASFSGVGMGRSFYRPSVDRVIEDFAKAQVYHAPTDRYYQMDLRGGDYLFRRYRVAADGTRIDEFEQRVDWILGSGNHARVYLYQNPDGTMYELPLAWYSQDGRWAIAPGFEAADQQGVLRPVPQRCMFCHNAYPDVPAKSDLVGMPDVFPVDLPAGIGCQRCHGPGAAHVQLAMEREVFGQSRPDAEIRAAIVDPGDLTRAQRTSLCYSCHFQPSVAVNAVLRSGRGVYSFRPGQNSTDYQTPVDVVDRLRAKDQRFDINHHPYRLEQSACFVESAGALECLTCHDPHRKVPQADRAAHYRAACLGCHETDPEGVPVMKTAGAVHPELPRDVDCTTCHMPERRTQDVIEVTMTDHRITRDPGQADLLQRITKREPEVVEVMLVDPADDIGPEAQVVIKTMAILNYTGGGADYATEALAVTLQRDPGTAFEPWLQLAQSFVTLGDTDAALAAARDSLTRFPGNVAARELAAIALFRSGDRVAGMAQMERLLADHPGNAKLLYNLAAMHAARGDLGDALTGARAVLKARPVFWTAWFLIGQIEAARGNTEAAVVAYRHVLSIEPGEVRTRERLVAALQSLGRDTEASWHRGSIP